MADKDIRMLAEAILDYLGCLNSEGENNRLSERYREILIDFIIFEINKGVTWENMFTFDTFKEFRKYTNLKNTSHALIGLSGYLHQNGRVTEPLQIPKYQVGLPEIYEQYILYLEQDKNLS